jgi:tRNA pseudouridine38-40 synthase
MRNIKLILEYDGTNYAGWQRQENARTVQEAVEAVLQQVLREAIPVTGSGRTDTGVHARGQTANFKTEHSLPTAEMFRAFNALLPDDIVVREICEVPEDFHSRFSATARLYSYTIVRLPTALLRSYSWYVKYNLDIDIMNQAAESIRGVHDFTSYCKANSEVDHHRCTVHDAVWLEEFPKQIFTIKADRFLHGMVRALVGTMVDVGRGYLSLDDFYKILEAKDRSSAGMAAPPTGLVLERVFY